VDYRDEFEEHKLDGVIEIKHQNVYKDGFELENEVDSGASPLLLRSSRCRTTSCRSRLGRCRWPTTY